jgi:hypothetical protein
VKPRKQKKLQKKQQNWLLKKLQNKLKKKLQRLKSWQRKRKKMRYVLPVHTKACRMSKR